MLIKTPKVDHIFLFLGPFFALWLAIVFFFVCQQVTGPHRRDIKIIEHQEVKSKMYIRPVVDWKESAMEFRRLYYEVKRLDATKAMAEGVLERHGSRKFSSDLN